MYEKDLGRIRIGQSAFITVDTYPNQSFEGKVASISDVLDPQTRTARVRCEVANHDLRLKTDMFANIELPTKFSKQALAVPASALQEVEGKNVVFIRHSATQSPSTSKTAWTRTSAGRWLMSAFRKRRSRFRQK